MRVSSQKDFCAGLLFLATGVVFAIGALNYTPGTSAKPGPGFFPLGLGVLVAVLGAAIVLNSLGRRRTEMDAAVGPIAWRPLVGIVTAVVLFGVCLPRLGLLLTLSMLIVVASLAGQEFRWREVALNCLVLTGGCWLLFHVLLKLTIPLWPVFLVMG